MDRRPVRRGCSESTTSKPRTCTCCWIPFSSVSAFNPSCDSKRLADHDGLPRKPEVEGHGSWVSATRVGHVGRTTRYTPQMRRSVMLVVILIVGCASRDRSPEPVAQVAFADTPRGFEAELALGTARISRTGVRFATRGRRLELFTRSIAGRRLPSSEPMLDTECDCIRRRFGDVVEEVRIRQDRLEQLWRFESKPDLSGDLVVQLDVSGPGLTGTSDAGLLFGDTAPLLYGHASWIDASGATTRVRAEWIDESIVLRVPRAVFEASQFPAVLDPVIGPAIMTEEISGYVPFPGGLSAPSLAFNGSQYLAVFGTGSLVRPSGFVRVALDGTVLDRPEIGLDPNFDCEGAAVFSVGADWHVWCGQAYRYVITGAGVPSPRLDLTSALGLSVGQKAFPIRSGDRWLLVWSTDGTESDVRGAIVLADGTIAHGPFDVATGPGEQIEPAGAGIGTGFLVVYTDDRLIDRSDQDIRSTFVSVDGIVSDVDGVELVADPVDFENRPAILPDDSGGGLLLFNRRPGPGSSSTTLRALHLDATGSPVEATPIVVRTDSAFSGTRHGYFDGSDHLVFRGWGAEVLGHRISATGIVSVHDAFPIATAEQVVGGAVSDGADGGLVAVMRRGSTGRVAIARLQDASGYLEPEISLVGRTEWLRPGAVAGSEAGYLSLYARSLDDVHETFVRALDFSGAPAGPAVFLGPARSSLGFPTDVASLGSGRYLAVFGVSSELYRFVLDAEGGIVDEILPRLTPAVGARISVGTSNVFLVLGDLWRRLTLDGETIDPDWRAATTEAGSQLNADAAAIGDSHLMVWDFNRSGVTMGRDVRGVVIDDEGVGLTPELRIAESAGDEELPVVTVTSDGWLVAWTAPIGVAYRTITATGAMGVEQQLDLGGPPRSLAITTSGSSTLVSWETGNELFGVTLASDGSVIDPPFMISEAGVDVDNVAGAASVDHQHLVFYQAWSDEANAKRAFARALYDGTPLGTACTGDDDCEGVCVDGVCCASVCAGGSADCQACSIAAGGRVDGACTPRTVGTECRSAASVCDGAEVCDGLTSACPPDAPFPDGTSCDDGDRCNGIATCTAGVCVDAPVDCDDGDACTTDSCNPSTGCVNVMIPGCGVDAGIPDAGTDAGPPDAGGDIGADAGSTDSGVDAGMSDGGDRDAGALDAGGDTGGVDVGPTTDGGSSTDAGDSRSGGGCSGANSGASTLFGLMLFGLLFRRRR